MRSSSLIAIGRICAAIGLLSTLAGCSSVQATAYPIGNHARAAKPSNAVVDVYKDDLPTRPYEELARLNVHLEKTFFIPSAFSEALPRLQELARQKGADAIIAIVEDRSRLNETFMYNVKATAIAYTD